MNIMIKQLFLVVALLSLSSLVAQEVDLNEFGSYSADELRKNGFTVLVDGPADFNQTRPVNSGLINFKSDRNYAIFVLIQGRSSCSLYYVVDGNYLELKPTRNYMHGITSYSIKFNEASGTASIEAQMSGYHWKKAYMIVGVK